MKKNTSQQPLMRKWTGPIDKSVKIGWTCEDDFTAPKSRLHYWQNFLPISSCADPERGTGGLDPPWKITKIGFLSNTGPDSLKNHKATKSAFNVGPSLARQRNAI